MKKKGDGGHRRGQTNGSSESRSRTRPRRIEREPLVAATYKGPGDKAIDNQRLAADLKQEVGLDVCCVRSF